MALEIHSTVVRGGCSVNVGNVYFEYLGIVMMYIERYFECFGDAQYRRSHNAECLIAKTSSSTVFGRAL